MARHLPRSALRLLERSTKWNSLGGTQVWEVVHSRKDEEQEGSEHLQGGLQITRAGSVSSPFGSVLNFGHCSSNVPFSNHLWRSIHSSAKRHVSALGDTLGEAAEVKKEEGHKSDAVGDTKALLRTATLTVLRERLRDHERAWIPLPELYQMCKETGTADSNQEAEQVVSDLDKAGVLIQLRDKAFLRPEEIALQVLEALPVPLVDETDLRVKEFEQMQQEKKAIDASARRHARRYLWIGWGALSLQTAFFFRLTFWELSWDVMEPITYFAAMTTGILGYAWFLFTRSEPSYSDAFTRFYLRKQEKVAGERHFDMDKYYRMQRQVQSFRKRQEQRKRRAAEVDDDDD